MVKSKSRSRGGSKAASKGGSKAPSKAVSKQASQAGSKAASRQPSKAGSRAASKAASRAGSQGAKSKQGSPKRTRWGAAVVKEVVVEESDDYDFMDEPSAPAAPVPDPVRSRSRSPRAPASSSSAPLTRQNLALVPTMPKSTLERPKAKQAKDLTKISPTKNRPGQVR